MDSSFAFLVCKNKANLVYYQTFMDCTMSTISASEGEGLPYTDGACLWEASSQCSGRRSAVEAQAGKDWV